MRDELGFYKENEITWLLITSIYINFDWSSLGLNLDEIVFFRHKEVIVYPDDQNKPNLGDGLNKKAQITLDKVWPTDKADSSIIKSSERLRAMNYEDKLVRASTRLGARFIEYRPETGSWVFRVDHFSKYGLDESDEEDGVGVQGVQGIPGVDNKKKMKTLHLEKRTISLDVKTDSSRIKLNTEVLGKLELKTNIH